MCSCSAWLWWSELSSLQLTWSSLTVPYPPLATAPLIVVAWDICGAGDERSRLPQGHMQTGVEPQSQVHGGGKGLPELPPCVHLSCFLSPKLRLGASSSGRSLALRQLCLGCCADVLTTGCKWEVCDYSTKPSASRQSHLLAT